MNSTFPIAKDYPSPLSHPSLRPAGVWEIIKDLINPKTRPFDCVQVEITSCCTAKCTYCPHTTMAKHWNSRHMEPYTFANAWPLLQQASRVHLQGWGEPLMHPHFFDFVALARKAGCLVSTTSCGLHLNEDIAKKIVQSGIDIIAFSLAGTDEQSNSARKGASFEKVYKNIKLLQEIRKRHMAVHLEIHLAYIMLSDNFFAVQKLPALMQDLQVHASIVSTLDYLAHDSQAHLAINPQDTEKIAQAKTILMQAAHEAKQTNQELYYALPSKIKSSSCRENIQKSLYIDADGNIAPCIYLNVPHELAHKVIFGNINQENILDIWHKDSYVHFRKAHEQEENLTICETCVKKFEILN